MRKLIFIAVQMVVVIANFASIEGTTKVATGTTTVLVESNPKEDGDKAAMVQEEDIDGGFSSLDGMLQWAIGHSDPGVLKERSEMAQRLSPEELNNRQTELKELMEKLKMPSDAQLMLIAVNDLDNSSLPLEHHLRALEELLVLVEHIDNAIDLQKLGGFSVLIRKLNDSEPEIRTAAAWVLGKASQNNPIVQKQVLELGALTTLMKMMKSHTTEEAVKALFAISALIRNNLNGQDLFYQEAGDTMLQGVLSLNQDIRLHKKSLFLIADLAESQLENENTAGISFFSNQLLLKAMVDSMASSDLDLQEKALYAIKNILLLRSTEVLLFKDFCKLNEALERTRKELQQFMVDEDLREYATDVESLRKEVELTFLQKLDKITGRFGCQIPVLTSTSHGIFGQDANTNEFEEVQWDTFEDNDAHDDLVDEDQGVLITVGFLPGLTVDLIPLKKSRGLMTEDFIRSIRECSLSRSGSPPMGILLFFDEDIDIKPVLAKLGE